MEILEQIAGTALVLFVAADIFFTVLFARIRKDGFGGLGTGMLSLVIGRANLSVFRRLAMRFHKEHDAILSLCGPVVLVQVTSCWAVGITCGFALLMRPHLGETITSIAGPTSTDFWTAFYIAGSSVSTAGTGTFDLKSPAMQVVFVAAALLGAAVITLTVTYLLQVYGALLMRSRLGLKIQMLSADSFDAAQLVAGLGARGDFSMSSSVFAEIAGEISHVKESHHFFSVLYFFQARDAHTSVWYICFMALDCASLIESALSPAKYDWLQQNAVIDHMQRSAMKLMTTLGESFVRGDLPDPITTVDDRTRAAWRRRFEHALQRLRAAGIETTDNVERDFEKYVEQRQRWVPHVKNLAEAGGYDFHRFDPATADL